MTCFAPHSRAAAKNDTKFRFIDLFDIGCRGRRLRRPGGKMLCSKAHLGEFVTLHAGRRGRRPLQRTEMTVR